MKTTALVAILDPTDYVRVLVGEQPTPSAFQMAAQVVRRSHIGKSESSDNGLVDEEQHY